MAIPFYRPPTLLERIRAVWQRFVRWVEKATAPPFVPPHNPLRTNFSVDVVRPDDLLVLSFDLYNIALMPTDGQPARLVRATNEDAFIVMRFPPQSVGEQAFFEPDDRFTMSPDDPDVDKDLPDRLIPPPVGSRLSGPSWLVFRVPSHLFPIFYTLQDLLEACGKAEPVVAESTLPPGQPTDLAHGWQLEERWPGWVIKPSEGRFYGLREMWLYSAVEVPYRLILSPHPDGRWAYSKSPAQGVSSGRTELWHARLGVKKGEEGKVDEKGQRTARAVWTPDFYEIKEIPPLHSNEPFRMSLDARDRYELVLLSSWPSKIAEPIKVGRLMLSALGAWLDAHGEWNPESVPGLTIEEWRHLMTMGRDHFVRVVYAGYLFPFGHRASLVKITERKLPDKPDGRPEDWIAYLRTRMFIIVREPVKRYDNYHGMPFQSVTIKPLVTPLLDDPGAQESKIDSYGQDAFWPRVRIAESNTAVDFHFHLVGLDWEERAIEFTAPLIYVAGNVASTPLFVQPVIDYYDWKKDAPPVAPILPMTDPRRKRPMGGQSIAYAPRRAPGDTTLETFDMVFGAEAKTNGGKPAFLPTMEQAVVDIPAVKQLLGKSVPSTISYAGEYKAESGDDITNLGDVFAIVDDPQPLLTFDIQKSGGLVAPDITISALSRAFGPVGGDPEKFIGGNFYPKDLKNTQGVVTAKGIFSEDVKILGGISLRDVIDTKEGFEKDQPEQGIPTLTTTVIAPSPQSDPVSRTTYRWETSQLVGTDLFIPQSGAKLFIETTIDRPLKTGDASYQAKGELANFSVLLLPALPLAEIQFKSVTFTALKDQKVDVAVDLMSIEFKGVLGFVNQLTSVIPLDGFADPPSLDIIPSGDNAGVNVGYTFGIPTVGLGAFTMQNISLTAGFFLPFASGKAINLHLAFCERHQPFILTVALFGGGGFVGVDMGLGGINMVEMALEFGASVALNLGVASGAVTAMGGVYIQKAGAGPQLSAYFRAVGALSVLGLITVSIEFYLGLNYTSKEAGGGHSRLWGQAKLKVKVKIAFFSKTVSLSLERQFAGSDPKFFEVVTPTTWETYCNAFAEYPA